MLAEDKLFATLDTRSRRLRFPRESARSSSPTRWASSAICRKDLFAAFRATFEEAADADLLLHVVDAADPRRSSTSNRRALLTELDLDEIPRILVFNKTDLLEPREADAMARRFNAVAVSAVRRQGLAKLIHIAEERLGREKPLMKTYGAGAARTEIM